MAQSPPPPYISLTYNPADWTTSTANVNNYAFLDRQNVFKAQNNFQDGLDVIGGTYTDALTVSTRADFTGATVVGLNSADITLFNPVFSGSSTYLAGSTVNFANAAVSNLPVASVTGAAPSSNPNFTNLKYSGQLTKQPLVNVPVSQTVNSSNFVSCYGVYNSGTVLTLDEVTTGHFPTGTEINIVNADGAGHTDVITSSASPGNIFWYNGQWNSTISLTPLAGNITLLKADSGLNGGNSWWVTIGGEAYGGLSSANTWTAANVFNTLPTSSAITPVTSTTFPTYQIVDANFMSKGGTNLVTGLNEFNNYIPTTTLAPSAITSDSQFITRGYANATYGQSTSVVKVATVAGVAEQSLYVADSAYFYLDVGNQANWGINDYFTIRFNMAATFSPSGSYNLNSSVQNETGTMMVFPGRFTLFWGVNNPLGIGGGAQTWIGTSQVDNTITFSGSSAPCTTFASSSIEGFTTNFIASNLPLFYAAVGTYGRQYWTENPSGNNSNTFFVSGGPSVNGIYFQIQSPYGVFQNDSRQHTGPSYAYNYNIEVELLNQTYNGAGSSIHSYGFNNNF